MNEVTRIHLARIAYDIDIDAKRELEKYLTAIKKSLGAETDAMEDIEIRITELLADRGVVKDSVITITDINAVREQLGEPKVFASDDNAKKSKGHHSKEEETISDRIGGAFASKKFFRDTDNAVLGGVISGLSAYTGWDVTLLRVLAVVLTIVPSFGLLIIIYIVIWICAPEANSVSEKLEMRGEPVNLDSIKNSAKDFGARASKVGEEVFERAEYHGKQIGRKTRRAGLTIARVLGAFAGTIGLIVTASLTFALVIVSNQIFFSLVGSDVTNLPLLIVSVSFFVALAALIVVIGVIISIGLLVGRFGRGTRIALTITTILATLVMIAAAATAGSWYSIAGHGGVDHLRGVIREDNIVIERENGNWCIGICR